MCVVNKRQLFFFYLDCPTPYGTSCVPPAAFSLPCIHMDSDTQLRRCPPLSYRHSSSLFLSLSLSPSLSESGLQSWSSNHSAAAAAVAAFSPQSRRGRGRQSSPARAVRLERYKTCQLTLGIFVPRLTLNSTPPPTSSRSCLQSCKRRNNKAPPLPLRNWWQGWASYSEKGSRARRAYLWTTRMKRRYFNIPLLPPFPPHHPLPRLPLPLDSSCCCCSGSADRETEWEENTSERKDVLLNLDCFFCFFTLFTNGEQRRLHLESVVLV